MSIFSWLSSWRAHRNHEARIARLEKLWATVVQQIQTVVAQVLKQRDDERRRDD